MIFRRVLQFIPLLVIALSATGQTMTGLPAGGTGETRQNEALRQSRSQARAPRLVVFPGDRVIPHFIDGWVWQTAMTVVNLENYPTTFEVLFFNDDGTDWYVPVIGLGAVRGVKISLNTAGSLTFQTAGTNPSASSGWALLSQPNSDSVGSFAIFRLSFPGQQQQEAVIPTVNQFSGHFVLPFDNTAKFVTGVALVNPTLKLVSIPVNIRNETGQIIDRQTFGLGPYAHTAFVLPETWRSTAGIRGTVEFDPTGVGVGALGLRFNGNAFTSLNIMSNFNWLPK